MKTVSGGPDTISDGLIMYMDAANTRCYPGTGTVWTDLSTQNNNGTLDTAVTFASTPSRFETNATLPADSNSEILSTNTLTFTDTQEYSFDFFVRLETGWHSDTGSSVFNMLTGFGGAGSPFVAVRPNTNAGIDWSIWWRQPTGVYVTGSLITNFDLTDVWVNFSFVITSDRVVTIYLNSVLLYTLTLATSAFQINRIASAYNGGDGNFYSLQGDIATARYYNRALSAAEVLQNYNSLKGRFLL